MPLLLTSPAFTHGSPIPPRYTCDGEDVSPPLEWSGVPAGTRSLALLVEAFGHSTQVAYDGPSALEKAQRNRPDIVLCDLGLPGMTGFDVARRLRGEEVPLVVPKAVPPW